MSYSLNLNQSTIHNHPQSKIYNLERGFRMPKPVEGKLEAKGLKFAVVVSRFNDFICDRLLGGADIQVVKVPGAWEIPLTSKKLAEQNKYDAIICLGAVIRGATPHFEFVSAEVSKGVAAVGLEHSIPITFGVLTTDSLEQAIERAGTKAGNKGFEAAQAAIEMSTKHETNSKYECSNVQNGTTLRDLSGVWIIWILEIRICFGFRYSDLSTSRLCAAVLGYM